MPGWLRGIRRLVIAARRDGGVIGYFAILSGVTFWSCYSLWENDNGTERNDGGGTERNDGGGKR